MALRFGTRVHGNVKRRRATPSGSGSFGLDIRAWCEKAADRSDLVVRKVVTDLLGSVISMSPVGNPELWAANAGAVYGRQTHNLWVDHINLTAQPGPRGGKPRRARRKGQAALVKAYPLAAGKGYVGGRFRGNWQVRINGKPVGETGRIDPSGGATLAAGAAVAAAARAGDVLWIQNNVHYAIPLEYGHSKQAPGGMVRLTIARFQQIVDGAAREAKAEIP